MTNFACPVCNEIIEGNICKNCGYVRIIFPTTVPESIIRFEQEQVTVLKNILNRNSSKLAESQKDVENSRRDSETLQNYLEEATRLNNQLQNSKDQLQNDKNQLQVEKKDLQEEKERLLQENKRLQEEKRRLQDENSKFSREKSEETNRLNATVTKLTAETHRLEGEKNRLEGDVSRLKRELTEAKKAATGTREDEAYLAFNDGCDFTIYPLGSSDTARFASGPGRTEAFRDNDNVTILPVITGAKIAFEIHKGERGYTICDRSTTLCKEGLRVSKPEKLMNKDTLSFEGTSYKAYFTVPPRKRR